MLRGTVFDVLHNKEGCKFYCFSNIFPFSGTIGKGDVKKWIISSPSGDFVEIVNGKLREKTGNLINIGEMRFIVKSVKKIKSRVSGNSWIDTATPVVVRIPSRNYEKYGMAHVKYESAFWRPEFSFEAFVKQIEENLFKKFAEFYGEEPEKQPLIEAFKFKKSTSNKLVIDGKERTIIGSIWNFKPAMGTKTQRCIWNFAIDTGLGEKNSQGFGFLNRAKEVN